MPKIPLDRHAIRRPLQVQFGVSITNSDAREVPVRLIGEQHVMEDLGTIPSFADWARLIEPQAWMMRGQPKLVAVEANMAA